MVWIICANNGMDYIDLERSKLYVKLKVKKANGEDLQDDDTVGPVNLFLKSLWSQLDVYIQGQMVTSSNTYYPYKCMMKTLLKYGQDTKSTQLSSSVYLKDRYGHMDEISTNTGLYERRKFISNSKTLEMEGPVFSDIFEMNRYLLNMLSLKLKLYRNDPSDLFCDGIPVDGIALKLDFNENSGTSNVSPYVKMFETGGKWMLDTGNEITKAEFNNGFTLLCFYLEPFFSDTKYLSLLKQGKIRLECQYGTPLPATAALLILAENYGYFEITENRQIKIEH
ncbi:unnamed protein product [Mytilus coruscus]|uniref:Uncharacterized protein n=1 Tax=Mytilus coruscus TaxID=42192 RepID=A0A6J8A7R0_MYTCO|nr:unnamed protein product [Mytilus coruscus]